MKNVWKWLVIAACGVGLLVAIERMNIVTASDDQPSYGQSGDTADRLARVAEKLERLLDRIDMRRGPGGPPPHGDHAGPPPGRPLHEPGEWGGPPRGPHRELPPEVRERMQQAREEMKERMEKARERFQELEARVKTLEADVERLKAGRSS
jgi:hypothetical protein